MSEHSEHPAGEPRPPGELTSPPRPAAAEGDVIGAAPYASPGKRPPSRFRRWSANASVRMGAVALVAGLVGGLVGGGIVAAFSDDGHDRVQPARFDRGGPWVPPGFRGPRYRLPRGRWGQQIPPYRQQGPPAPPAPTPTSTPAG